MHARHVPPVLLLGRRRHGVGQAVRVGGVGAGGAGRCCRELALAEGAWGSFESRSVV